MQLAIRLFGSSDVTNYSELSLLASDNLRELVFKCDELVCDSSFRACIVKASGCTSDEVDLALKDSVHTPEDMADRLTHLNRVFSGLLRKLPVREYKRVDELGDMEEPEVSESCEF